MDENEKNASSTKYFDDGLKALEIGKLYIN